LADRRWSAVGECGGESGHYEPILLSHNTLSKGKEAMIIFAFDAQYLRSSTI
jgi:hypothetical protein